MHACVCVYNYLHYFYYSASLCCTEAPKETAGVTLEESAAAEQAKQSKPSLQEVEVITGEEDESNVFHVSIYPTFRLLITIFLGC